MIQFKRILSPFLFILLLLFIKSNELTKVSSESMDDINVLTILHPELTATEFYGVVD